MKRVISLLILGLIITATGFAQVDLQPVAIVRLTRSEPITVRQHRIEVERMESQLRRSLNNVERRQILDIMINERLIMQAAERDRITVTDNEVNSQITQLRSNMAQTLGRQPTDAEFAQALRNETGMELPAFREELRKQLVIQRYIMDKSGDSFTNIPSPSEQEIVNAYSLRRTEFVRPETVRFSVIQVPYSDPASQAQAKIVADRLVREIGTNPARFDEAMLRGQLPNADYEAGDGGYLPRNVHAQQVVGIDFMNAAFNLRQGEVSRLLENPIAFHIIKVTETYEQKNLELDDIFQLGTRITVREFIGNSILQERQQAAVDRATQGLVEELRRGNPFQIVDNNLNW